MTPNTSRIFGVSLPGILVIVMLVAPSAQRGRRGGALRDSLVVEDELEAQNPSEFQRKLLEQQQKRDEALKQHLETQEK